MRYTSTTIYITDESIWDVLIVVQKSPCESRKLTSIVGTQKNTSEMDLLICWSADLLICWPKKMTEQQFSRSTEPNIGNVRTPYLICGACVELGTLSMSTPEAFLSTYILTTWGAPSRWLFKGCPYLGCHDPWCSASLLSGCLTPRGRNYILVHIP